MTRKPFVPTRRAVALGGAAAGAAVGAPALAAALYPA